MRAPLSLEEQKQMLCIRFPKSKPWYKMVGRNRYFGIDLRLKPMDTSATYLVRIAYAVGRRPLVFILNPKPVEEAHGIPTPHLNPDHSLCLFDPDKREWTSADPLVDTMLPWAMRWLVHYEHWIVFGDWRGDPLQPVSAQSETDTSALLGRGA